MKKKQQIVQDDRILTQSRQEVPPRVPARLEGVVKNAGIKNVRKEKKPRAK